MELNTQVLDYLWGLETWYNNHKHRCRYVLDYLWGLETSVRSNFLPFITVVLDYLWGLETVKSLVCLSTLWNCARLPMRAWNHIRAIGYLVLVWRARLPMRAWNYFGIILLGLVCFGARLPMRAWNPYYSGVLHGEPPVLDYLWGLETQINVIRNMQPTLEC